LPGWKTSTEGIAEFGKLPLAAQDYLKFLEQESGARVGMVSTGPDRDQVIMVDDFASELNTLTESKRRAQA
jgi:adenylosuccinate synthase